MNMWTLAVIALTLVIVGALNWLLIGLFNYNLVSSVFGERSAVSKIVYILVGVSGIFAIWVVARVSEVAAAGH